MYIADIQQILLYEGMIQPTVVMEVGHVQTQLLGVNPGGLVWNTVKTGLALQNVLIISTS